MLGGGLLPDLHEPLDGRDGSEDQHHPERGDHEFREQQCEGEHDDALGTFHDAALGIPAERLGLGPLVRDEHGKTHDRHRQHHDAARFGAREVPRNTSEEHAVGESVAHRIEIGPALRAGTCGAGHRSVEGVGDAGEDKQQETEPHLAQADAH